MTGAHLKAALRKSSASKGVAFGFIAAILLGNFWIGFAAFGIPIPTWLTYGLSYTAFFLFVFIVLFLATALYLRFAVDNPPAIEGEDEEDNGKSEDKSGDKTDGDEP